MIRTVIKICALLSHGIVNKNGNSERILTKALVDEKKKKRKRKDIAYTLTEKGSHDHVA